MQKPVGISGKKLGRKRYEAALRKLQEELCHLQAWVKAKGLRIIVVFEGRDAAGKGGVIKCITDRVSPRVFRTVALPAPTEREKSQMYFQRYIEHFPAGGEVVLFDRSWYNRAGVERVMGFCTDHEYERFMRVCPVMEAEIVDSGIILLKYFFDVSQEEQEKRFRARVTDARKQWKLSPMDVAAWSEWWNYSEAYDRMFMETDTTKAPWNIVRADDKRRARLNCITHLLGSIDYEPLPFAPPELAERKPKRPDFRPGYDKTYIPEVY